MKMSVLIKLERLSILSVICQAFSSQVTVPLLTMLT